MLFLGTRAFTYPFTYKETAIYEAWTTDINCHSTESYFLSHTFSHIYSFIWIHMCYEALHTLYPLVNTVPVLLHRIFCAFCCDFFVGFEILPFGIILSLMCFGASFIRKIPLFDFVYTYILYKSSLNEIQVLFFHLVFRTIKCSFFCYIKKLFDWTLRDYMIDWDNCYFNIPVPNVSTYVSFLCHFHYMMYWVYFNISYYIYLIHTIELVL